MALRSQTMPNDDTSYLVVYVLAANAAVLVALVVGAARVWRMWR